MKYPGVYMISVVTALLLCSCVDKPELYDPEPEQEDLLRLYDIKLCDRDEDLGISELRKALFGVWDWVLEVHYSSVIDTSELTYEGLALSFYSRGEVVIQESSVAADTFQWTIRDNGTRQEIILLNASKPDFLKEAFYVCDDQLVTYWQTSLETSTIQYFRKR